METAAERGGLVAHESRLYLAALLYQAGLWELNALYVAGIVHAASHKDDYADQRAMLETVERQYLSEGAILSATAVRDVIIAHYLPKLRGTSIYPNQTGPNLFDDVADLDIVG